MVAASTGDPPVPSGDSPDETGEATLIKIDANFQNNINPIPVGGSPTGAGGSPAPPMLQSGHRRSFPDLIIAGPAPAPLLRAETFYRYQIMLQTRAMSALSRKLARIIQSLALPEDVTLAVDIDPVNLG